MRLLYSYLRRYWTLVALALLLAAVNQIFSLLDPLIFRHVIDEYATRYREYTTGQFFRGVSLLLAAAVGVAFVSRLAKNFQDYFVNVVTQRLGADLYSDGIRHSLALPFPLFEDQRSGETLGKLQKVRTDVEKLIAIAVNMLFTTLGRARFRDGLRLHRALDHRAGLPAHRAGARRRLSSAALEADQDDPEGDRRRDHGARRLDHRVAAQHRAGEEPGARRARRSAGSTRSPARSSSWSCARCARCGSSASSRGPR